MKKVVAALLLVIFLVTSPSVSAQGKVDDPNSPKISQKEFAEYTAAVENCETPSLECLVRYTTRFVAMEWVNEILGPDNKIVDTGAAPTTENPQESTLAAGKSGLIPGTFSIISLMYANPVANSKTYVADVMDSAGLAPKAYAQGLGFASLNPVLNLWKAFRNIAYFFFIILFIVIGFMIMFRQKLGGQAVVTAQQAIPSIIVSLVLVTFSYAIAGFMIDLMYLVMFMIVGLFGDAIVSDPSITAMDGNRLLDMNIFDLTGTLFKSVWGRSDVAKHLLSEILDSITKASQNTGINQFASIGGGMIITLVISIAVLIGAFRLFFELLKSYFSVVVGVVTAPIMLMLGAVPGKNVFLPWLKNIIGNLAAFPAVLLVLVLFLEFTKNADDASTAAGGFMPPYLIGIGAGIIGPLMGLATILALPEIVKKAKTAMGATEGGVFWELAGAAANNAKGAWEGKGVPGGWGARKIVGQTAAVPVRMAGAYGGYKFASAQADKLGLKGAERTRALWGGAAAGAAIAPRLPSMAIDYGKQLGAQLRDAQIKQNVEDIEEKIGFRSKAIDDSSAQSIANAQKNATPGNTATQARGNSSSLEERMKNKS